MFAPSDVYDSTAVILSRNRAPGTGAKGNDIARDSKGARRKGQREVNWTESIDNPGEIDKYQAREVFGNEGGVFIEITWGSG